VTGGNVFNQQRGAFEFLRGPVFTQLLLADEINRAPAKTQSSLLEAMQERSVTIDGTTRPLPEPFFVIATQNPIESQGTYPLPEAQLDRFLFKLDVRAPNVAVEKAILASHLSGFDASALDRMHLNRVTTPEELVAMQTEIRAVRVDDSLLEYIADIVWRTRSHRSLYFGPLRARRSRCWRGRRRARSARAATSSSPTTSRRWRPPRFRHRVGLQPDAEIEGVSADDCVAEILREVRVPATIAA
jgi:MoxR-like ATPase